MRKFVWTPNFYVILVGPPGVAAKSTSISIGLELLNKLPPEIGIRFGPESMTWQALADALSKATEYVKYMSGNGVEDIVPMSSLTISVGELGTFLTMDDDKLLSFLIRMWDGGDTTFLHATKHSGLIEVKHPWLNVIAATTPTWLSQNVPQAMIGGGLTSRIIFVYGDRKRTLIPYPDEVVHEGDYYGTKNKLLSDLAHIASLAGPYRLHPDARKWGREWYAHLYNGNRPIHMASERYSGWISRKQTHLHKLGMVLAAAQRDDLEILEADLIQADAIISMLEPTMLKVFESIGIVDEAKHLAEIVSILRAHGQLDEDALWQLCMNLMSMPAFGEAIRGGVKGGLLRVGSSNGRNILFLSQQRSTLQ